MRFFQKPDWLPEFHEGFASQLAISRHSFAIAWKRKICGEQIFPVPASADDRLVLLQ